MKASLRPVIRTPKRRSRPIPRVSPQFWWLMPVPPLCPKCGIACKVYKTKLVGETKVQYRKCPTCLHSVRTAIATK